MTSYAPRGLSVKKLLRLVADAVNAWVAVRREAREAYETLYVEGRSRGPRYGAQSTRNVDTSGR